MYAPGGQISFFLPKKLEVQIFISLPILKYWQQIPNFKNLSMGDSAHIYEQSLLQPLAYITLQGLIRSQTSPDAKSKLWHAFSFPRNTDFICHKCQS